MAHVVIIGCLAESLVNFRSELIKVLGETGHEVTVMAAPGSQNQIKTIESLGASFMPYPVTRSGLNPLTDLRTLINLRRMFRDISPDVVLAYTIKPVIWGGLAAMTLPKVQFHALITGLGFAFQGQSWHRKLLTKFASMMYKLVLSRAETVIFQNRESRNLFVSRGIANADKCYVVKGSGVNLSKFTISNVPTKTMTFLLIARLLKAKGVLEFLEAARLVKQKNRNVVFQILGPADPSPDGISMAQVRQWEKVGIVDYLGETKDVRPFIKKCSVFVLPSYHEGMPRAVLEAMATGRPILTTGVPGCRETVQSGENGFLFPAGDPLALAERMEWFLENRKKLKEMGSNSRRLAEERFDVRKVNAKMLKIIGLAGDDNSC